MSKVDDGLRALFRRHLRGVHWQSVETRSTSSGVPDSNYCLDGREGWIEYKRTGGWTVPLRPMQVGWHATRARHGGRTLIAVRRRNKSVDQLWVFRGVFARTLKQYGLRESMCMVRCEGGPRRWDWDAVRAAMLA